MRQRLWSRALGIVVAAALLGAVGGTSDLDAFLYHPTGGPIAFQLPHVESPSHADCHSDRCVLALVLANRGLASTLRAPVRPTAAPRRPAAAVTSAAPHPRHPGPAQQPRAPPPPVA